MHPGDCLVVTGGAGFMGSALVRRLLATTDAVVVNVDKLTYAGNLESLAGVQDHPRHRFYRLDVADAEAMHRVFEESQPAAVLHLAAESHVDRSIDAPAAFVQTNLVGTFTLLEASRRYWSALPADRAGRFRFLHVSTDEVYGSLGPDGLLSESSRYDPSSPYAATKAGSDHLVQAWARTYGLPALILQGSNTFGPRQYPEKLIPLATINALEGAPLPVYGRGDNVRDWLHVEDAVDAMLRVLEAGRVGETYLVGGGAERANRSVVEQIADLVDAIALPLGGGRPRRSLITFVTDRPGHDFRYGADAAKVRRELGWAPRCAFEDGLRETVAWYCANRAWWERVRAEYRGERLGLPGGRAWR